MAHRDDARVARRLYRKPEIDGVYRLDEGAGLDDFVHFLRAVGVMALLEQSPGAAIQRERSAFVQDVLRYGVKTLFGIESINALPSLRFSDAALMQLVGVNAQQVRQGSCPRGATMRQGERAPGPLGPDTLAKNIVTWNLRDLEAVFNGRLRALAKAGGFGALVTGIADGTDLETTERYTGCGQVTRTVRLEDKRGTVHAIEVTVYGWKVLLVIDTVTKIPLAVNVGPIQEREALWTRALATQARLNRQGDARLHKVIFAQGFVDGPTLWWLDQHSITVVVPATAARAVTVDARAQAATGEDRTVGRRVNSIRHGQGQKAWSERLETEVVGITALTT